MLISIIQPNKNILLNYLSVMMKNMHNHHNLYGSEICLFVAVHILTSPGRGSKGSFIGYSPAGLPLYSFTQEALQRTSHSVFKVAKNGLKQILEESDSRKIFYFLCLNLVHSCLQKCFQKVCTLGQNS